jgi:hypothetical protein
MPGSSTNLNESHASGTDIDNVAIANIKNVMIGERSLPAGRSHQSNLVSVKITGKWIR